MSEQKIFEKVKKEAEDFYKNLDSFYCPYLKTQVKFNSKGLNHIKMKAWNKTRSVSDQYMRLKFLKLAPAVLSVTGTLQEFHETNCMERLKFIGKWQFKMVPVKYYGFVAIINKIKIKIIVKETSGSSPYFWSIIPFWKTQKDEICQKIKKVFHDGDLEND